MHSNTNLCCIEWFQYNLEIWSKKELGTLWKHPLTSEWCCIRKEGVCGPRSVTSPSRVTPKEPQPSCSWPRQCCIPDKLLFAFHDRSPKLPFQHAETFCVLIRESKMLELNQLLTADYPTKVAVPYRHSYITQHNYCRKTLATFVCVWEQSTSVQFLN